MFSPPLPRVAQRDGETYVWEPLTSTARRGGERETAAVISHNFFSGTAARSDGPARRDLCKMLLPFVSVLSFCIKWTV